MTNDHRSLLRHSSFVIHSVYSGFVIGLGGAMMTFDESPRFLSKVVHL